MLRYLLRRPRMVKIPIDQAPVDVQRVRTSTKSKYVDTCACSINTDSHRPILSFTLRLALAYCAFETVRWLKSDDFKKDYNAWKSRKQENTKTSAQRPQSGSILSKTQPNASLAQGDETGSKPNTAIYTITMPVWFRKKENQPIPVGSPEWQAYHDFLHDAKRKDDVRKKVYTFVANTLTQHPYYASRLEYVRPSGESTMTLTFIAPLFAAPSYEIPAVSISPSSINFFWKALPGPASARAERIFHPRVFLEAWYVGLKSFSDISYKITKARILDYLSPEPLQFNYRLVEMKKGRPKYALPMASKGISSRVQRYHASLPISRMSGDPSKYLWTSLRANQPEEGAVEKHLRAAQGFTMYQDAFQHGAVNFKVAVSRKQSRAYQSSQNGILRVKGFIDVHGQRGILRVEIEAFYSPKSDAMLGHPDLISCEIIPNMRRDPIAAGPPLSKAAVDTGRGNTHASEPGESISAPPPPVEKPTPGKDSGK